MSTFQERQEWQEDDVEWVDDLPDPPDFKAQSEMHHKSFDILEAKADSEAGTFEAIVAVFGNVDKIGDRVMPGAFKNTLAKWAGSGDPIPVILSHQWDNPMAHIGVVDEAVETEKGLFVKGTLDVADNDVARQVHRLMKRRSLKEFSFGYSIPKGGERKAKDGANELMEIELAEVGPTLKGMNPATELHAVKSALGIEDPKPPDPKAQRKEAERVARDAIEEKFPEVPPAAEIPDPEPEPEPKLPPAPTKSVEELRREMGRIARDVVEERFPEVPNHPPEPRAKARMEVEVVAREDAESVFPRSEIEAAVAGDLKAVWTVSFINDLPDSAFLYVEPGGSKDADGKTTPRSLRHFPYKDATGAVDLPHLRNALSRIPQSSLPQDVKDRLAARAQRILDDSTKSVDVTDKEPRARSVDPLRKQADAVALEFASDGQNLQRPPKTPAPAKPEPEIPLGDLKRRMREEILVHLSGGTLQ